MKDLKQLIEDSLKCTKSLLEQTDTMSEIARLIVESVRKGGRVFLFGNGGSAADAQHLAAEMVGKFERDRKGIPAFALTTDTSILTAVSNDYGFETVFERQVQAHVRDGDVVIGISTSGTSPNVVRALRKAMELKAATVLLTGAKWKQTEGETGAAQADLVIVAGSQVTARVQEAHILTGHIICYMVEEEICGSQGSQ